VGLAEYLANTIPIISSSLELLFERFNKNTFIIKSADIVQIWQKNNAVSVPVNFHTYIFTNNTVPNKEPRAGNSFFEGLSCDLG